MQNSSNGIVVDIYANARQKLAQSAVFEKTLKISGGAVQICTIANDNCGGKCGRALRGERERGCSKKLAGNALF